MGARRQLLDRSAQEGELTGRNASHPFPLGPGLVFVRGLDFEYEFCLLERDVGR
jgi:hypothetical protein